MQRWWVVVVALSVAACSGGAGTGKSAAPPAPPFDAAAVFAAQAPSLAAQALRQVAAPGEQAQVEAAAATESARWAAALELARVEDRKAGGPGVVKPAASTGARLTVRPALVTAPDFGSAVMVGAAGVQMVTMQSGFGSVANPAGVAGGISGVKDGVGFTMDIDRSGGVSLGITTEIDLTALFLKGNSKAFIRGNTCPDASGKVDYYVEISSSGKGRAGSASYGKKVTARVTATTNDNADVVEGNAELVAETTTATGTVTAAVGQKLGTGGALGDSTYVVSTTGEVSDSARRGASEQGYADAVLLARGTLAAAEAHWKGGTCIAISAKAPGRVDPGSSTVVDVTVTSKAGGSVPAKVTIALSGKEKVDRASIDKAPGSFTYTAPNEKDATATIELKATSRQGRATRSLDASTKEEDLRVSSPYGFASIEGTKCAGPAGSWTLKVDHPAVVETLQFTLAGPPYTGQISGTRLVGGQYSFPKSGVATFDPDALTLTLATDGGTATVPVTRGKYC